MKHANKCKQFLDLLKLFSMRATIDLFVFKNGFDEFLKVKKTLSKFKKYTVIYTAMQKALLKHRENASWIETSEGIFHFIGLKFDGEFVNIPEVYLKTFPRNAKFYLMF